MKTLHLNLKRKWFDMFLSGIKTEEYREIKESMISILFDWKNSGVSRKDFVEDLNYDVFHPSYWSWLKDFDTITFSNGYAKNRDQFVIEFKNIEIRKGNPEWGAEKGKKYFVLETGEITTKKIKTQ